MPSEPGVILPALRSWVSSLLPSASGFQCFLPPLSALGAFRPWEGVSGMWTRPTPIQEGVLPRKPCGPGSLGAARKGRQKSG